MDWNLEDFRKPVNLVFLGIAVVSFVVTVITYLWSRHESNISYYTATIQIVDQKESVPFSVIDKAGQRVTENVYATNLTVWNSGDLPIDAQNVRSPLTISLTAPVRLLDKKLDYATSGNISEFRIDDDPTKSGVVQIGWRFFDPKEGFRLRLIYAAKDLSTLKLNGVIFGISSFVDITPPPKETISIKQPGAPQLAISALLMVCSLILMVKLVRTRAKGRATEEEEDARENPRRHIRNTFYVLMSLSFAFQIWAMILSKRPPSPPF